MKQVHVAARLVLLLAGTGAAFALVSPASAAAADTSAQISGTLRFEPASGVGTEPLTAVSTGVCSDPRGTNLQLQVVGSGFPASTNVTPNLEARIYPLDPSSGGYDVPLQDTLSHFAAQQSPPAVLSGRYDFTLVCKKPWGEGLYNTYTGSLWFSSPTHYRTLTTSPTPTATAAVPSSSQVSPQSPVAGKGDVSRSGPGLTPGPVTTQSNHAKPPTVGSPPPPRIDPSPVRTPASSAETPTRHTSTTPSHPTASVPKTLRAAAPSAVARTQQRSSESPTSVPASAPTRLAGPPERAPRAAPIAAAQTKGQALSAPLLAGLVATAIAILAVLGFVLRRRVARNGPL